MFTLEMVEPRWQWTPTKSSALGSFLISSRNHCKRSFLMPNLELLIPVETYG